MLKLPLLQGLLIALVLILVARPLAVWASALPFQFRRREITFLCWVGLKGAVPITLATFPLLAGVTKSDQIFNAVFRAGLMTFNAIQIAAGRLRLWLR